MIPIVAILRFETSHRWGIPWPIPVFLLWIPALLFSPLVLLVLWAACWGTHVPLGRTIAVCWGVVCGLPGADVRVCSDGRRIQLRIL